MAYINYEPVTGTIVNINRGSDCCSQMMSLSTNNGVINFMISADTKVVDCRPLRVGLRVVAFYDNSLPVPLIFPPQYAAQLVTVIVGDEQVVINEFGRNLVATDGSLQLNIARTTGIETINGQNVNCNLENHTLLVYYSATTRSIPPQTTPRRIVVLC